MNTMKNIFDISNFVSVLTIEKTTYNLVNRFVKRRKELKLSQKKLSIKSGVSYSSIRRFENSGEISLTSLLKLAQAIDCLEDFYDLFKNPKILSLKEIK